MKKGEAAPPDRAMETKGAIPVPDATNTAARGDSRWVKTPYGPANEQRVPSGTAASAGESEPPGISLTQSDRLASPLPLTIE